jgi:hypothetical protein
VTHVLVAVVDDLEQGWFQGLLQARPDLLDAL